MSETPPPTSAEGHEPGPNEAPPITPLPEPFAVHRVVYTGQRVTSDDTKLCHRFQKEDGDTLIFTPKRAAHWLIGQWYDLTEQTEGAYYLGSMTRVANETADQRILAAANLAMWRIDSASARGVVESVKAMAKLDREAKEANVELGDITLRELRTKFAATTPAYRAAMLTATLRYLGIR